MAPFRTVAIIGASGVLGQPVTRQLAKAGYNLTLISRDSAKLKQTFGSLNGVKYVAAEPSDSNRLTEAFKGIDVVLSVIGSAALGSQVSYVDAAVKAGVKRFIPSEFGCDTQSPPLNEEFIFGQKREVAAYLKQLAEKRKINYSLVYTGLFFGLDLPFPLAGIDWKAKKADIIGTGDELFSVTHLDDIGRYLAAIFKRPEITENKQVRIIGDTTTANAVLAKFEKKVGQKFEVTRQDAQALHKKIHEALDKQDFGTYFANAIPSFTGLGYVQIDRSIPGYPTPLDNSKFPEVKPLTVDEIIFGREKL